MFSLWRTAVIALVRTSVAYTTASSLATMVADENDGVVKRVAAALACLALIATGARANAADDRTATDGKRSLAVSKVRDLNPDGEVIEVKGSGYDENKGIYVAFCLIPPKGEKPSPCAGGEDRDGASGSSVWISGRVTDQSLGAKPYGPNGSFSLKIYAKAVIDQNTDCRSTRCAVVTRNDHFASDDRSQDLFVPVTFRATSATTKPPAGSAATTLAPPVLPTTTTTTIPSQFAAPDSAIAPGGLSVSGAGKTLRASKTTNLEPTDTVEVSGDGYDAQRGIYLSLCAVGAPGAAPGPCASGSAGAQAWISSNPPDYGRTIAVPYDRGGAFRQRLTLTAVIDAEHDCREISCAITTRNDDTNAADRSQDLLLPVTFSRTNRATATTVALRTTSSESNRSAPLAAGAIALVALVALGGVAAFVIRKRSAA